ncbi:MAG: hypothetical protein JXR05_09555 [Flavobacteriaceae bacterium]
MLKKLFIFLFIGTILSSCNSEGEKLEGISFQEQLKTLFPKAKIDSIKVNDHFTEAYQLIIQEPLDHKNPDKGTFEHYIYVSHYDYKSPTVLVTEGYNARHQTYELSKVLNSNQVMVEYRFYGKSRPNPIPWEYLTNDQAVEDYHAIVSKLKQLYQKKWISTGISKGGETVLIYKSKYPKDMDVAVPYVAPLINTQEDPRTNELINSVGTDECRTKIVQFQRAILKNRKEIMVALRDNAAAKNMSFTKIPIDEALEHSVLEFPFSFWQWGSKCEEIPNEKASPKELFAYLNRVSGFYLFSDAGVHHYLPSFYQHMTELGYYGYDLKPVKNLLEHVKTSSLACFGPQDMDLSYNPNYIKEVRDYVENKGNEILYIYGEYDPWGACSPNPKESVDALKMVLEGADHGTRIKHFSKEDQQKIYDKLQTWLGKEAKITPTN